MLKSSIWNRNGAHCSYGVIDIQATSLAHLLALLWCHLHPLSTRQEVHQGPWRQGGDSEQLAQSMEMRAKLCITDSMSLEVEIC